MAKSKSESPRGALGFEEYYSAIFGQRWPVLKEALLKEGEPLAFTPFEGGPSYYLDAASVFAAISLPLEGAQNILDMCAAPGGKSLVLA
ncbi:MAG: RsmB/NOP family class I SAM-dependent RNA methyltransferase, partial [Treponema sp.]|nr:RsmB/NOP family class I SAM-dependent RNA methyltransferase [Treponema sp.]